MGCMNHSQSWLVRAKSVRHNLVADHLQRLQTLFLHGPTVPVSGVYCGHCDAAARRGTSISTSPIFAHHGAGWCWYIYLSTQLGSFIYGGHVGLNFPAPWFAYGSDWAKIAWTDIGYVWQFDLVNGGSDQFGACLGDSSSPQIFPLQWGAVRSYESSFPTS